MLSTIKVIDDNPDILFARSNISICVKNLLADCFIV